MCETASSPSPLAPRASGVVNEDIDRPDKGLRFFNQTLDVVFTGQVTDDDVRAPALEADRVRDLFCFCFIATVDDDDYTFAR